MASPVSLTFSEDRRGALEELERIEDGSGWVNVSAMVEEDVEPLRVNVWGLRSYRGVAVATWVPAEPREGPPQAPASTLGILHSRGRLGPDALREIFGSTPIRPTQDHPSRGVLADVPPGTSLDIVLDTLCRAAMSLCDYTTTGRWRLERFSRTVRGRRR